VAVVAQRREAADQRQPAPRIRAEERQGAVRLSEKIDPLLDRRRQMVADRPSAIGLEHDEIAHVDGGFGIGPFGREGAERPLVAGIGNEGRSGHAAPREALIRENGFTRVRGMRAAEASAGAHPRVFCEPAL